ncbi:MAG: O-antigen ligase family protein [Pyrinomonadaceae bacterium]
MKKKISRDFLIVLMLALLHLPLGVVLYSAGSLNVLHPLFIFGLGLFLAFRKPVNLNHVCLVVAYIIGAEVLWRMAQATVAWEFGKYASATILLVALVRSKKFEIPSLPLLYFALLIPACILTIVDRDLSSVTPTLSFNMSGPLVLMVSCWFFYKQRISPLQFRRLLCAMIIPLICVAVTALFYTVTAEEISFNTESNFETSGGFGPNQVSGMLGLGVYLSVAGFILFKKWSPFSLFFGAATLLFSAICVLTFSRGGIYNAIGGIVVLLIFGLQDIGSGLRRIAPVLVLGGLFLFFIYPVLDDFTGGHLQERFEDTGTTNRSSIAQSDFQIFFENPVLGVGVGAAYAYRQRFISEKAASHTEFSRMVSEHGAFGLAALILMLVMLFVNLKRPNSTPGKAFVAGLMAWACLFMTNTGMRLAAASFVWGISFITIAAVRPNLAAIYRRVKERKLLQERESAAKSLKPAKSF